MKKRILGLLTAVTMTAALVPAQVAFADGAVDSQAKYPLGVGLWVPNSDGYSADNYVIEYSETAKDGDYSLRLYNVNEIANRSIFTSVAFKQNLVPGETYRISFDHYSAAGDQISAKLNATDGSFTAYAGEYLHFEAGWQNHTFDYTSTGTFRNLQFQTWKGDRCIDNVSVRKVNADGTLGDEIAYNGGFEAVKVRDVHTQYPTGWFGRYEGSRTGEMIKQNTYISSTDVDAHSGNRSMMVNVYQEIDNTFYSVLNHMTEGLVNGQTYLFDAWVKYPRNNGAWGSLRNFGGDVAWGWFRRDNNIEEVNGWYHLRRVITGDSSQDRSIGFNFWNGTTVLIDDVSVRKCDADGNVLDGAEELVYNGDFEDYLDFEAADPDLYTNNNWTIGVVRVDANNLSTYDKADYMRFEETEPGNYALHVNYEGYEKGETFVKIVNRKAAALENGANYTVEYDIKASGHDYNSLTIHPFGDWGSGRLGGFLENVRNVYKSVDENGWMHCVSSADVNRTSTEFVLELGEYCDVLIDNIKVYKTNDPSKTNIIYDGDFQMTTKRNVEELQNVVAYATNTEGVVTVSWTNAYGTNEDIKVYVGNEEQEVEINSDSAAFNQIYLAGLVAGETYEIKVTATVNGTAKEYVSSVKLGAKPQNYSWGIGDWDSDVWGTYVRDNAVINGYANTNASVVTDTFAEGKASVMVKGNIPQVLDNVYAGVEQTVELERNQLYRMTFKAKGENVNRFKVIESVNLGEGNSFWVENGVTLTKDWAEYTLLLDPNANANGVKPYDPMAEGVYDARILISTDQFTGAFWIDDVKIYAVDPDDEVTSVGENVVVDGGFETPELVLEDAAFSINGEASDKLVEGIMNVSVKAENEGNLFLTVALYKDGALYSVEVLEKSTSELSETYNTSLTVPALDTGVYTAKVLYWNADEAMSAYRLPVTIAE